MLFVPAQVDFGSVPAGESRTHTVMLFNASPDTLAVRTADLTPLPPGVTVTGTDAALSSNDAWPLTVTGQAGQAGLTGRVELSVGGRAAALQLVGRVG